MTDTPDEGDYVKFAYTTDRGREKTARGEVTEADTNPEGLNNLAIRADEAGTANQEIHYFEGPDPDTGETYRIVQRYSPFGGKPVTLGDDASFEILG